MIALKRILEYIDVQKFIGDDTIIINDIIQFDVTNQRNDIICWCSDKNIHSILACKAGTIICSKKINEINYEHIKCNYIIVDNPRLAFGKILRNFFMPVEEKYSISSNSVIHPSTKIGKNVYIGDFSVIEKDCVIGDNTYIGYNNAILARSIIGNEVKIGNNNVIGGVGFGYQKTEYGDYELLPHIGNVIIKDRVEVGNNTCIDRAVLGSTIIHRNVKIDNLVHIAHGVIIDENSLIIAHTMIGGSAKIGKNTWIAPGALIINKGEVEDDSLVGMGAVVVKKVNKKTIVAGNPAKVLRNV